MTIKEQISVYLQKHPERIDDDMLARNLNLSARQQANSQCRQLVKEGLVERRKVGGKIHNFWIGGEGGGVTNSVTPVKDPAQEPISSKKENCGKVCCVFSNFKPCERWE